MNQIIDLPEEVQPVAVKAVGLREQNVKLFEKLESMGGGADIHLARLEHLIMFLVSRGIITEMQRWEEELIWETDLREQLKGAVEHITQLRAEAMEEQKRKERVQKLIVPPGMRI